MNKYVWWVLSAITVVVVCAIALIANFPALKFVSSPLQAAQSVVSALLAVTLLIERSLAAINAGLFAEERGSAKTLSVVANAAVRENHPQAFTMLQAAAGAQAAQLAQEDKIKIYLGFVFALLLSAFGVRTLEPLFQAFPTPCVLTCAFQHDVLRSLDILLTAGLITGGSKGLNDLLTALKSILPG